MVLNKQAFAENQIIMQSIILKFSVWGGVPVFYIRRKHSLTRCPFSKDSTTDDECIFQERLTILNNYGVAGRVDRCCQA